MLGNGGNRGKEETFFAKRENFWVWLMVDGFTFQSIDHCAMDGVHTFEGVHYIPIKVIKDKEQEWGFAS